MEFTFWCNLYLFQMSNAQGAVNRSQHDRIEPERNLSPDVTNPEVVVINTKEPPAKSLASKNLIKNQSDTPIASPSSSASDTDTNSKSETSSATALETKPTSRPQTSPRFNLSGRGRVSPKPPLDSEQSFDLFSPIEQPKVNSLVTGKPALKPNESSDSASPSIHLVGEQNLNYPPESSTPRSPAKTVKSKSPNNRPSSTKSTPSDSEQENKPNQFNSKVPDSNLKAGKPTPWPRLFAPKRHPSSDSKAEKPNDQFEAHITSNFAGSSEYPLRTSLSQKGPAPTPSDVNSETWAEKRPLPQAPADEPSKRAKRRLSGTPANRPSIKQKPRNLSVATHPRKLPTSFSLSDDESPVKSSAKPNIPEKPNISIRLQSPTQVQLQNGEQATISMPSLEEKLEKSLSSKYKSPSKKKSDGTDPILLSVTNTSPTNWICIGLMVW